MYTLQDITALTVSYDTKELLQRTYESFRKFHPSMKLIIVDGSPTDSPCGLYVKSLQDPNLLKIQTGFNIGHGRGLHAGIAQVNTSVVLIMDSDIEIVKSPVEEMLRLLEPTVYSVGYLEKVGLDGYDYGAKPEHRYHPIVSMMHPFFALINRQLYYKYHRFVHHGAPWFKTAVQFHELGLSETLFRQFPGLGHTSGKGFSWDSVPLVWVKHDTAGTRKNNVRKGKPEIEQGWER